MFTRQNTRTLYLKGKGLAERAVQTAKKFIRKCKLPVQDIHVALVSFRNMASENRPHLNISAVTACEPQFPFLRNY